QSRRQVPGLEFKSDILRHTAAAAQQHRVSAVVEPFEAALLTGHQRVVLEPKAQVESQVLGDAPPVAHVKRILPLTAGHGLGLNVFGKETRLAQQESRERVPRPSPRRDVAGRSRGARAKAEPALQAVVAELGLAMIQFQLDDVNANSHFMLGEDLRESAAEA